MNFLEVMKKRHSSRDFKNEEISKDKLQKIVGVRFRKAGKIYFFVRGSNNFCAQSFCNLNRRVTQRTSCTAYQKTFARLQVQTFKETSPRRKISFGNCAQFFPRQITFNLENVVRR